MIQANELRIGNLLAHWRSGIQTIVDVENIHSRGINVALIFDELDVEYEYGELLGLPITEEWFLKAGFVNKGQLIFDKDFFTIRNWNKSSSSVYFNNVYIRDIHTVHQLQNIFFILCGQELTFNL